MAAKLVALADGQTALSLGLTGIHVERLRETAEVERRLAELLDSDTQVVILDAQHQGQFSEWFSNRLVKHVGLPLVIFCPAFEEEDPGTDAYINSIVKPAVGFEIRLD